jgi:hypothetical protein
MSLTAPPYTHTTEPQLKFITIDSFCLLMCFVSTHHKECSVLLSGFFHWTYLWDSSTRLPMITNHSLSLLYSAPLGKTLPPSFIQSTADGHLDCFQFCAFPKSAARNILWYIFWWTHEGIYGIELLVTEIYDQLLILQTVFLKQLYQFTQQCMRGSVPPDLCPFGIFCLFNILHLEKRIS